jgi:hypothetical protein
MERRGNLSGFSHSGTQNDNKDVKVNRNANTDVRFERKQTFPFYFCPKKISEKGPFVFVAVLEIGS